MCGNKGAPDPDHPHRRATTLLEVGGLRLLEIDDVTDDLLAEPFDELVYRRHFHRTSIAYRRRRVIETTNGGPRDAAVSTIAALLEPSPSAMRSRTL